MSRLISKFAQLLIKEHGSTTATPEVIGALASWSLDESCTEIDATGVADSNKQYLPGQRDAKGEFTLIVDPEDDGQEAIATAQKASTLVDIIYREQGTGTGKPEKTIPAYITTYSKSASVDARIELSCAFVAGGAVTDSTQTS